MLCILCFFASTHCATLSTSDASSINQELEKKTKNYHKLNADLKYEMKNYANYCAGQVKTFLDLDPSRADKVICGATVKRRMYVSTERIAFATDTHRRNTNAHLAKFYRSVIISQAQQYDKNLLYILCIIHSCIMLYSYEQMKMQVYEKVEAKLEPAEVSTFVKTCTKEYINNLRAYMHNYCKMSDFFVYDEILHIHRCKNFSFLQKVKKCSLQNCKKLINRKRLEYKVYFAYVNKPKAYILRLYNNFCSIDIAVSQYKADSLYVINFNDQYKTAFYLRLINKFRCFVLDFDFIVYMLEKVTCDARKLCYKNRNIVNKHILKRHDMLVCTFKTYSHMLKYCCLAKNQCTIAAIKFATKNLYVVTQMLKLHIDLVYDMYMHMTKRMTVEQGILMKRGMQPERLCIDDFLYVLQTEPQHTQIIMKVGEDAKSEQISSDNTDNTEDYMNLDDAYS